MKPRLLFRGPILTASGYGVHSRQLLASILTMDSFDVSVLGTNWGQTAFLSDTDPFLDTVRQLMMKFEVERQSNVQYDVSVQCTIANEFEKLARVNIGVTAGIETDVVSAEWLQKVNQNIDLLIVPSQHSHDVFRRTSYKGSDGSTLVLQKPIVVVPEGIDSRVFNTLPTDQSEQFKFDTSFNFLYVGLGIETILGEDRKNLGNLIKWFCERYRDDREVGLIVKTAIVNGSLVDFEMTKNRIKEIKRMAGCMGEFPRVHLIHGRLTDSAMAGLYKHPSVKAFVTTTCGEGYGLPLIEAAACGLPVIATNWSGHLDFLQIDGKKKFVALDFEMKNVPPRAQWKGVIEPGANWAFVKEDDFKNKLKKVQLSYEKPKAWADELAVYVRDKYDIRKVAFQFANTLANFLNNQGNAAPQDQVQAMRAELEARAPGKRLLYTMPMSGGDVYISTAIVDSLKKKYPDHAIFFATDPKYSSILEGNPDITSLINWEQWMMNIPLLEQLFDEVYTPNIGIQMMHSNWVHRGKGRLLGLEMAAQCNVPFGQYKIEAVKPEKDLPEKYIVVHPGSGVGQWAARNYLHWQDVISNLVKMTGIPVVQVGLSEDPLYSDVIDMRGQTPDYRNLAHVISNAQLVVGIDSITMHLAAGHGTPHVAIFGGSYSTSTGPVIPAENLVNRPSRSVLMDTPDRHGCDKACYKNECTVTRDNPCLNEIEPKAIVEEALRVIANMSSSSIIMERMSDYKEFSPSISGYTHILNPEQQGFPYLESIRSMLGFCDEVVVVDGGSTDGSIEKIKALNDDRVKLMTREWDWNEPGMDGLQKAFGRAMCTGEFLWQQDADEVVHEKDYGKIKKIVKTFPKDVKLLHLPVVEFWGGVTRVRTDRHSWKWRLSKNDFRVSHGINKDAKVFDKNTGKTYATKGMSDGCEYIDIMTGEYIPHRGFYTREIEKLRQTDPTRYGDLMNEVFEALPSVYHYSWADLKRKVTNFREFWDKCWSNLYNETDRTPRFDPEKSVDELALQLDIQGGEHNQSLTFDLKGTNPVLMAEWITKISQLV